MTDGNDSDMAAIDTASVQDVVRAITNCKGHYCFLIGAGTSRPAGIETAGDLIDEWRIERYNEEHSNGAEEIPDDEFHDWAESYEEYNIGDEEDRYGFWFEQQYTTRGERRNFIREKVENKDPTFGINVLASLMDEGYIPLTLTTNFDDLLYDALYRFIETKPFTIDHNAIAAEFRLTKDRPTIIKLHGDYLYDNLQNTAPEKETLQKNMERALSRALNEYGLVVVGYGGTDESIMDNVLLRDDLEISEYGVFWCGRDIDNLSTKAEEFLQKDGTHFVEIEGSEPFFTKVSNRISEVDPPTADELQENADRKIKSIDRTREQRSREASTEEEKMHLEALNYASQASQYLQDDEWQKAIDRSTEAIELQSGDGPPSAYFTRARAYQEKENHAAAIEDYSSVLELRSEDVVVYNNRGNSYHSIGEHERAIEDRTTAIELDPEYVDAYYNRGNSYNSIDEYEYAIEDYTTAIELDPEYVNAYNNRGNAYHSIGEYKRAIEDHTTAIELDPEKANAYNNRGNSYNSIDEYEYAIEDYTTAIELDPEYVNAYNNRGNSYNSIDEYEYAIEDYTTAIELDPNYVSAYNNRGISYGRIGEHEHAIDNYTKAIELSSEYTSTYINRSESRLHTEAYDASFEDARKGYELADDPDLRAAGLMLALIAKIVQDEEVSEMEREYREICSQDFTSSWSFEELEAFLNTEDLKDEKETKIREIMALLREHREA